MTCQSLVMELKVVGTQKLLVELDMAVHCCSMDPATFVDLAVLL